MLLLNAPGHTPDGRLGRFHPGRVAALRPTITRTIEELCDGLDGTFDFVERLAFLLGHSPEGDAPSVLGRSVRRGRVRPLIG